MGPLQIINKSAAVDTSPSVATVVHVTLTFTNETRILKESRSFKSLQPESHVFVLARQDRNEHEATEQTDNLLTVSISV